MLLAAMLLLIGCGSDATKTTDVTLRATSVDTLTDLQPVAPAASKPPLATRRLQPGEVRFVGEGLQSIGPKLFGGGVYTARFVQFAPDDPTLDFRTDSSSIVIQLNRRPGVVGADTVTVTNATTPNGATKVTVPAGRWYADVSADHRYVVRFTPAGP